MLVSTSFSSFLCAKDERRGEPFHMLGVHFYTSPKPPSSICTSRKNSFASSSTSKRLPFNLLRRIGLLLASTRPSNRVVDPVRSLVETDEDGDLDDVDQSPDGRRGFICCVRGEKGQHEGREGTSTGRDGRSRDGKRRQDALRKG